MRRIENCTGSLVVPFGLTSLTESYSNWQNWTSYVSGNRSDLFDLILKHSCYTFVGFEFA